MANDVKVDNIDDINALKVFGMVNPLVWNRTLRHAFQPTGPGSLIYNPQQLEREADAYCSYL